MLKKLLNLDLQFFSDGEEFGAYDPQSAYDGIGETTPEPVAQPNPAEPQNQEPQAQPDFLDFGGRKVPALNEDLLGLHKDYTEQQRYITALQDQVNAYKQLATVQQSQVVQPQAQEPQVTSDVANWDEETWQKFYDQPQSVIGNLINSEVQKIVAEKIDPIVHETQWNKELSRLHESYPDFDQFTSDIQTLVEQNPEKYADQPGGLEDAYFRAKAMKGMVQPSPEALAQDPRFIQQFVLGNPQVQEQVLNQYFSQKQQFNQQIPNVMGRGGGFTPQTPESSPTTLREASRQFMKSIGHR